MMARSSASRRLAGMKTPSLCPAPKETTANKMQPKNLIVTTLSFRVKRDLIHF